MNYQLFGCPKVNPGQPKKRDSLSSTMLITRLQQIRFEGYQEPPNEIGFLSSTKRILMFELRTFQYWIKRFILLGCTPYVILNSNKPFNTWCPLKGHTYFNKPQGDSRRFA